MENIRTVHDGIGSRIGDATLSGVGFLAKNTGKLAWKTGKTIGKLSLGTAGILGRGAIGLTSGLGKLSVNLGYYGGKNVLNSLKYDDWRNPIGKAAKGIYNFSSSLVKYVPEETVYNATKNQLEHRSGKLKLTGRGKVALAGTALFGMVANFNNSNSFKNMGSTDTNITTATPVFQNTKSNKVDFGGATGDLVFALHNNR